MRQNLEELETTQEEMRRQSSRSESLRKELEVRERIFNTTSIITESDLHGNIIKVNDRLCEVSRYSRGELMGKPHNTLRHPDMPRQIFKLLWQTIKQGNTFRGVIKNRAKDGSHYWVDTIISPVLDEAGNVRKYISVRHLIPDDSIAESLYQKMLIELDKTLSPV